MEKKWKKYVKYIFSWRNLFRRTGFVTLLKSSKPELRDRGALMTRCLQTWKVDLKFGRSSKSLFIETPTRRHQKADCFQSNQTQGLCSKAQRHPKASKGLKPENFHGPSRIFWCLLRSSAVDAVRTINPEEPPMSPPGRREMVMKWKKNTEVSNIGCMMFRKFYIYYSILVSVSVQDACQPHISHIWVLATTILDSLALSQYTKTVLKNMKGFEWDLGQGLCERVALQGRLKQSSEKWCPTLTPCHVEGQPHLTMSASTVRLARRRKGSVWIYWYSPSAVPPLACWDLHGRFMISWPWLTSKTGNCSRSFPLVLDISFQDFSTLVTLDLGGVFWEIQWKRRIWCLEINDRQREFACFF